MTAKPITLPAGSPLSTALGLLREKSIHEIPILRGKVLLGLITFESIARRTNLPLMTKVDHLLVLPPLITLTASYPEIAEQLLAAGMRAAPVVGKKGELVGIISRSDLVRALPDLPSIAGHTVEEIASPPGLIVEETDPSGSLFHQIRLLEEHPLPVVDRKGRLVGAVGVADLGRVLWRPTVGGKRDAANRGNVFDVEIGSIMHSPAVTVAKGTTAGAAAALMSREKISSVFVVEDGRPTGVVSQPDLLGLAVGRDTSSVTPPGDVYVQVTGLRGSGDLETLAEIDHVVAKGLRHIARHAHPILLNLHISPQGTHRSGDASVQARLHTDRGIYYASQTGWNFFAGIATLMDELETQVRRTKEEPSRDRRRNGHRGVPQEETTGDPELEARMRAARGSD
jgi:CBS domain-containing protein